MKHVAKALEKTSIYNVPCDSVADDNETLQDSPEAVSNVASRVTSTEDALAELVRITLIHTKMLKDLQTANAALSEQLKSTTMRLKQMEVEFRALRDTETIDFTPQHLSDGRLLIISPDGHHCIFDNPLMSNITPQYDNSQWTDMSGLAVTLAVAPLLPDTAVSASSRSTSSICRESRSFKPYRFGPFPLNIQ